MAVYAFANGKGGVGKTATTRGTGAALSRLDHDVVVVDADLSMSNMDSEADGGLHDVLAGERDLADALVPDPDGPSLLPGQRPLEAVDGAETANLPDVFGQLAGRFEFVLVDTAAGLRDELVLALDYADGTFVVTTPRDAALENGRQTARLARKAGGTVLGTVVARATPDTDLEHIESTMDLPVVGVVPDDPDVGPASLPADGSPAAEGYETLARLLEACRDAADPVEAVRDFETPSLSELRSGEGPVAATTAGDEGTAEAESGTADSLLDGSGTRMGTARSAEDHLDRLRDAMDRAGDGGDDT